MILILSIPIPLRSASLQIRRLGQLRTMFFLIGVVAFLLGCPNPKEELIEIRGKAFGTNYQVKYFGTVHNKSNIEQGIEGIIAAINGSISTYIPTSIVSRINSGDSTVVVDKILEELMLLSFNIHKNSNGYFDPTIGGLRNAYGFGDTDPMMNITAFQLDSMMKFVGLEKVKRTSTGRIKKKYPEIYLDFNAIGKGYAVDKIAEYFLSLGLQHFIVEIGGEVKAQGINLKSGAAWTIGIEQITSNANERKVQALIQLHNVSIAGSGNYRRSRVDSISGKKYVHTIDPTNGEAIQSSTLAAYVIAKNCAEADAYATAFMAMGIEKSIALLKDIERVDAYFIYADSSGRAQSFMTKGFEELIIP